MNGLERMTPIQREVTREVMEQENAHRDHLVVHLSGAHAYGFPSVDSDLDLKAIHVAPTRELLGFAPPKQAAQRMEFVRDVEVDYTSNEVGVALRSLLRGDGNMLERVTARYPVHAGEELDDLLNFVPVIVSKAFYRHYRGFAWSQKEHLDAQPKPSAKKLLYVLRTALTGTHLLLEGECEPDLLELYERYGFAEVPELVELKQDAERGSLPNTWVERVPGLVERAFEALASAHEKSALPEQSSAHADLEAWLIEVRKRRL